MSLINDALKRANQNQKQGAPPTPPETGLKPVERNGESSGGLSKLFAFLLVAGVLCGAGWFLWQGLRSDTAPALTTSAPTPSASSDATVQKENDAPLPTSREGHAKVASAMRVNTNIVIRPGPAPSGATAPAPAPAKGAPAETALASGAGETNLLPAQAPASAPQPAQPVAASSVAKPSNATGEWPQLRLQGIFYRLHKPSVRLNGKILYVGDEVDGARLVEIHRESVTLEFGGQTKVLPLKQ